MAESMIERCTRAAMEEVRRQLGGEPIPGVPASPVGPESWAAQGDPGCIDFALVTQAIMRAMWEPTDAMLDYAWPMLTTAKSGFFKEPGRSFWKAAIAAAIDGPVFPDGALPEPR